MDSTANPLDPFSASYQLVYNLDNVPSVTRCGCVINDTSLSVPSGMYDVSLDSEFLIIGDVDGVVRIWRISKDGGVDMINEVICHEGTIMDLIASRMLNTEINMDDFQNLGTGLSVLEASLSFYTCGRDRKIHRFNLMGQKVGTFVGHEDVVCSLEEFDEGQRIVSGSWDGTAIVWNVLTGVMEYRVGGNPYKYSVYCKVISDGTLITGMTNGDLCFWKSGTLNKTLQAHSGVIRAISIKGDTLLTCSNDCSVRKYDSAMNLIYTIPYAHQNFVYDVRHSSNFPIFFTSSEDKTVGIWDLDTGQMLQQLHLESSIWKVIETKHHGIAIIPMSGTVSIWQLLPGVMRPSNPPQVVTGGRIPTTHNKQANAEASFDMVSFKKANAAKALEYLHSYNSTKTPELSISPKDFQTINDIFNGHAISNSDLSFVLKLVQWPTSELLPVFDLLKVLFINTSCSKLFNARNNGFTIYNCVCSAIENSISNIPLLTVSLQLLCNMFHLTLPRGILLSHITTTLQAIEKCSAICTKMVQQAHSACIQNLVIASGDKTPTLSQNIVEIIHTTLSALNRTALGEPWIGTVVYRHCKSLETLICLDNKASLLIRQSGLQQFLDDISKHITTDDKSAVENAVKRIKSLIN
ncbi:phospholipase A-2-activating protein [Babesia ovis]|uniref:Phospholipase A-2-activating protein n=1 Tax=Babesia ovis TaxID=5869 RepID=A0A9W5TDJ2_BABOV|nr:phospholipase A-2-activating protein [Babesia ovis]